MLRGCSLIVAMFLLSAAVPAYAQPLEVVVESKLGDSGEFTETTTCPAISAKLTITGLKNLKLEIVGSRPDFNVAYLESNAQIAFYPSNHDGSPQEGAQPATQTLEIEWKRDVDREMNVRFSGSTQVLKTFEAQVRAGHYAPCMTIIITFLVSNRRLADGTTKTLDDASVCRWDLRYMLVFCKDKDQGGKVTAKLLPAPESASGGVDEGAGGGR